MARNFRTSRTEITSIQGVVGGSKKLKVSCTALPEVEIELDMASLSRAFDAVRDKRGRIGWKLPVK